MTQMGYARREKRVMAQVYPERLPESILVDPKLSAERKLYQALFGLGDKFTVFHSVAWQADAQLSNHQFN